MVSGAAWGEADGAFSSPWLGGLNDEWSHTFAEPGVHPFFCSPHEAMVGTITVHAAPSTVAPPTTTAGSTVSTATEEPAATTPPAPTVAPSTSPTNSQTARGSRTAPDRSAYAANAYLDNAMNYRLWWRVNTTERRLYLAVDVNTTGWVGLGFSATGGMRGSDVVIGYVASDGWAYISDRHAEGNYLPARDDSQDYVLHAAAQTEDQTFLEFSRDLDTCDSDDMAVAEGTSRVIWSYHLADPSSPGFTGVRRHVARGTKSINLVSGHETDPPDDLAEAEVAEYTSTKTIPDDRTMYGGGLGRGSSLSLSLSVHFSLHRCPHPPRLARTARPKPHAQPTTRAQPQPRFSAGCQSNHALYRPDL